MSVLGGITGAVLLLVLPASAFKAIVPVFIVIALVLTVLQPRLSRWLASARSTSSASGGVLAPLAVYVTGVYGGYFGAAQGILLLGDPRRGAGAEPAAHERPEERARGPRQRRGGGVFHLRRARRVGPGGDHRLHLDRRARSWARATGGGCRRRALRVVIVVVGIFAIVRLLA